MSGSENPLKITHLFEPPNDLATVRQVWYEERHETLSANGEDSFELPLGVVVLLGPDKTKTDKIIACILLRADAEPLERQWLGNEVTQDEDVQQELDRFFAHHGVESVLVSEGNVGCIHEEGEDFPIGKDCPFCPYWQGR